MFRLKALERLKERTQSFKGGQPDEEMLKWFLRDRSLDVDEAVDKLRKVTAWRRQARPDALSEDDVFHQISTGKGYMHDQLDLAGRPVVVVRVAKHFPGKFLGVTTISQEKPMAVQSCQRFLGDEALSLMLQTLSCKSVSPPPCPLGSLLHVRDAILSRAMESI